MWLLFNFFAALARIKFHVAQCLLWGETYFPEQLLKFKFLNMNKTSFSIIDVFLYKTFLLHCSVSTYTTINHFGKIHAKTHGFSFFFLQKKLWSVISIWQTEAGEKCAFSRCMKCLWKKIYFKNISCTETETKRLPKLMGLIRFKPAKGKRMLTD